MTRKSDLTFMVKELFEYELPELKIRQKGTLLYPVRRLAVIVARPSLLEAPIHPVIFKTIETVIHRCTRVRRS